MTPERCSKALDDALERNVTVKFLLDALAKAGCPVTRRFFTVEKCDTQVVGGFRPGDGVRFTTRLCRLATLLIARASDSSLSAPGCHVPQPHNDCHGVREHVGSRADPRLRPLPCCRLGLGQLQAPRM